MGSALGPTFANFYVYHLENKVLKDTRIPKPLLYIRYVDDISVVVKNFECLNKLRRIIPCSNLYLKQRLKNPCPFLMFSLPEMERNLKHQCLLKKLITEIALILRVYALNRYKTGVVKSILHRAFNINSSWHRFSCEVDRIKQLLTNNNFRIAVIDEIICQYLNKK